ncbi:ATP-binding cassette domain-containing protein [Mollicutes bacterium LVI A0039]|nr:ATP-binding cassette domain-containing protein [Mollicutes bacterium LVI A0039]
MLEIKNLKYGYDLNSELISDLSLTLKSQSFNSILGSNGSGKSTLCKLIAHILKPDLGEILLDGRPITDRDVAIVFQNPADQFVRPIVYNDLAFGLENLNIDIEQIDREIKSIAEEFNIEHLLERNVNTLSGGEMQRVAIASSILLKPRVLILDEATDMLDPITRSRLLVKLTDYARKNNVIIIYITHDMELAFHTDNIIIIGEGNVKFIGTPLATFNNTKVVNENRLSIPYNVQLMKQVCGDYCYTSLDSFKEMYELKT